MTVPLKSTVGRIKKGSTVYAAKNLALNYETVGEQSPHSGLQLPTNVRIAGAQVPVLSFQMYFADAYAAFGFLLGSTATVVAYFANLTGAIIDSGSTHSSVALAASPAGAVMCTHLDGCSVSEGGEFVASCKSYFFSADGDADPVLMTVGSEALPALTAMPVIHGIGVFSPDAVALPGMTGFGYQSGLSLTIQRTDGLRYATGGAPSGMRPIASIEHADPISLLDLLGSEGIPTSASTTITFLKYAPSGQLIDTGKKTLTIGSGYGFIRPKSASVEHGQLFKGGCEILMASTDGVTHPLGVS